jgi:hypothetical protein
MSTEYNFKLKAGLTGLGCSALAFASLAVPPLTSRKISQQVVSQLLTGAKEFDSPEDAREFLNVIATMEYLQQTVTPKVPINWSDILALKDVLIQVHEQRQNEQDPIVVQSCYVRMGRLNFLKGINSAGPITTINPETQAAAFADLALAQEAIRRLKDMGHAATFERLTSPRRKSTIATSLEEIGFKNEVVEQ